MARNSKRLQAVEIISNSMKAGVTDSDTIIARIAAEMYGDHATPLVPARACYRLTLSEGFCEGAPALARKAKAPVTEAEAKTDALEAATAKLSPAEEAAAAAVRPDSDEEVAAALEALTAAVGDEPADRPAA